MRSFVSSASHTLHRALVKHMWPGCWDGPNHIYLYVTPWGPKILKSQTGQISRKFSCFGTIDHFLAPLGVLTPTSILNHSSLWWIFNATPPFMGSNANFRKNRSGFDFGKIRKIKKIENWAWTGLWSNGIGRALGDPKLDIKNSGFEAPGPLWSPLGPQI